jgi:hypothetical protein
MNSCVASNLDFKISFEKFFSFRHQVQLPRQRSLLQLAIICITVSGAALLFTPYGGDDLINHNTLPNLGFVGSVRIAYFLAVNWLHTQGRLFPVATFWMAFVFYSFRDLFLYKTFLFALLAAQCILQSKWLLKLGLGDRRRDAVIVVACIGCGIWTGLWPSVYNPFNSFHGMFILSGCLGFAIYLFWMNERIALKAKTIIACSLAILMFWTYELNIIFVFGLLALPGIYTRDRQLLIRARWIVLASILYFSTLRLFFLSLGSVSTAPKYTLSIKSFSIAAFADQFFAPFVELQKNLLSYSGGLSIAVVLLLFACCGSILHWRGVTLTPMLAPRWSLGALTLFSALFLIIPPLLFATQSYWQLNYPKEGIYLYIYYQLIGFTILLFCLHQFIAYRYPSMRHVATALIFFLFMATTVVNIYSTQSIVPGEHFPKPLQACRNLPWEC